MTEPKSKPSGQHGYDLNAGQGVNPVDKLRTLCLALPEVTEDHAGVGSPLFKVRDKIFAMHPRRMAVHPYGAKRRATFRKRW